MNILFEPSTKLSIFISAVLFFFGGRNSAVLYIPLYDDLALGLTFAFIYLSHFGT